MPLSNASASGRPPSSPSPLLVIIPMAGLGTRFSAAGYKDPKPMIPILTRPMIVWLLMNLNLSVEDEVCITLRRTLEESHNVSKTITKHLERSLKQIKIRFVLLNSTTRGAADTLLKTIERLPEHLLDRRVVSLDCDTLYFSDILSNVRELPEHAGGCGYFFDTGNAPLYSYIRFEPQSKRITSIAEKIRISNRANTGAYVFPDTFGLKQYLQSLVGEPTHHVGEIYTSTVIDMMLQDNFLFCGFFVTDFACVGTPEQLETFFLRLLENEHLSGQGVDKSVVLDLETVKEVRTKLQEGTKLSLLEVEQNLDPQACAIITFLMKAGFKVYMSLDSGLNLGQLRMEFPIDFADAELRKKAAENGFLFPLDESMAEAIGWWDRRHL